MRHDLSFCLDSRNARDFQISPWSPQTASFSLSLMATKNTTYMHKNGVLHLHPLTQVDNVLNYQSKVKIFYLSKNDVTSLAYLIHVCNTKTKN